MSEMMFSSPDNACASAAADDAVTPAATNAASDVFKMECMVSSQYASVKNWFHYLKLSFGC
jgi:hypothetical protein